MGKELLPVKLNPLSEGTEIKWLGQEDRTHAIKFKPRRNTSSTWFVLNSPSLIQEDMSMGPYRFFHSGIDPYCSDGNGASALTASMDDLARRITFSMFTDLNMKLAFKVEGLPRNNSEPSSLHFIPTPAKNPLSKMEILVKPGGFRQADIRRAHEAMNTTALKNFMEVVVGETHRHPVELYYFPSLFAKICGMINDAPQDAGVRRKLNYYQMSVENIRGILAEIAVYVELCTHRLPQLKREFTALSRLKVYSDAEFIGIPLIGDRQGQQLLLEDFLIGFFPKGGNLFCVLESHEVKANTTKSRSTVISDAKTQYRLRYRDFYHRDIGRIGWPVTRPSFYTPEYMPMEDESGLILPSHHLHLFYGSLPREGKVYKRAITYPKDEAFEGLSRDLHVHDLPLEQRRLDGFARAIVAHCLRQLPGFKNIQTILDDL